MAIWSHFLNLTFCIKLQVSQGVSYCYYNKLWAEHWAASPADSFAQSDAATNHAMSPSKPILTASLVQMISTADAYFFPAICKQNAKKYSEIFFPAICKQNFHAKKYSEMHPEVKMYSKCWSEEGLLPGKAFSACLFSMRGHFFCSRGHTIFYLEYFITIFTKYSTKLYLYSITIFNIKFEYGWNLHDGLHYLHMWSTKAKLKIKKTLNKV